MALNIFRRYYFKKDGSIDYERSSKSLGMTKSDLYFLHKGHPDFIDCCLSCPPYFVLEIYSHDENQSVSKFSEYNEWLEKYWRMTVKNCLTKLKKEGYFILIMIEKYKKYDLGLDMSKILIEEGLVPVEVLEYKTVKNHLSHKKVTKEVTKSSEKVYVFRKRRSE